MTNPPSASLTSEVKSSCISIAEKSTKQKGVYTVLVTLLVYKKFYNSQDIRYHQKELKNGFSGRSFDTKYITPTLKKLGLPSMSESGWLTRSLEQPYPYTLTYNGKISDKNVKTAFLFLINEVEEKGVSAEEVLELLLYYVYHNVLSNVVNIKKIENGDKLTINRIIDTMTKLFLFNYHTHGGSKLPVIAFYAIYSILVEELKRYEDCTLGELGKHTASDRTSKSSGDIEIFKDSVVFESLEIKLNKEIDEVIVLNAIEKIKKFGPVRYYILSNKGIDEYDKDNIRSLVKEIKQEHGCQIIINGLIPTLKYYLRLITDLTSFLNKFTDMIILDSELKVEHKQKWKELLSELTI